MRHLTTVVFSIFNSLRVEFYYEINPDSIRINRIITPDAKIVAEICWILFTFLWCNKAFEIIVNHTTISAYKIIPGERLPCKILKITRAKDISKAGISKKRVQFTLFVSIARFYHILNHCDYFFFWIFTAVPYAATSFIML